MRDLRAGWLRGAASAMALAVLAGCPARAQPVPAAPSPRVALVIGEGAYRAGPLPTAPNDAGLVAQVLAGAGFDVTGARDLDGDGMRRAIRDFLDRAAAAGPDGVAVVYFAGRAVQSDGDDFLVPVDARLARPADVPIEALRLADFTHALAVLPIQARVVVVDGAYSGGFAAPSPAPAGSAASAPGLALAEAEQGELLAFNAAPGTAAAAGSGPYGVYAQALAAAMKQGGVPVGEVFDRVRLAVNGATGGAVVPWDSDKLTRSFAFFDRAPGAPAVASAQVPFAALERRPLSSFPPAEAYDVAVARDTLPGYAEFIAAYPDDPLARRVRLLLAVRREALFWRAAVGGKGPDSYWTYLARYPKGPHAGDARRRLARLAAASAPPPRFVPVAFDVAPPGPDELVYDRVLVFDAPDLPTPPPPPVFLLPPPVVVVVEQPAPPPGPLLLPVPVAVAIPYVRPPVDPGILAPPRFVPGGYARPRPYARGPNGDGLVVQAAPAQATPPQPAPVQPPPPAEGRPRPPASPVPVPVPAAPPVPAPPAPQLPTARPPSPPASPSPPHALPPPPQAAPALPVPPPAPPRGQPGLRPPAVPAPGATPPAPTAPQPALPSPHAPPRPAGAAPGVHRPADAPPSAAAAPPAPAPAAPAGPALAVPKPPHPAGAPAQPRPPAMPAPAAPPAAVPVPPAARPPAPVDHPRPPAAQPRTEAGVPEPPPPRAVPHPAPRLEPEPPRAAPAVPPPSAPPPARHAPDSPAPERPAAALPGRGAPEHPPGEHRGACGHPGEPPCRP